MRLSKGKILALKPYVLRTYPERRRNWADPFSGYVTLSSFMECGLKVTISCADLSSNTSERIESVKGPARAAGGNSVGQKPLHKRAHHPPGTLRQLAWNYNNYAEGKGGPSEPKYI